LASSVARMKEYGIVDSGDALELGIGAMTDARMANFFDKMVRAGVAKATLDYRKSYTLRFVDRKVGLQLRRNWSLTRSAGEAYCPNPCWFGVSPEPARRCRTGRTRAAYSGHARGDITAIQPCVNGQLQVLNSATNMGFKRLRQWMGCYPKTRLKR